MADKKKINAFFHVGGRLGCWTKFSKFLEDQTYDHSAIKLIVVCTVELPNYKEWLESPACDYEYVYLHNPIPVRRRDRSVRFRIMNANQDAILAEHVNAEYLWFLDDDVIPPLNVVDQLLPHFNTRKVMSVSAPYRLNPRMGMNKYYCAWGVNHVPRYYTRGTGVQIVGGNGQGCVLLKMNEEGKMPYTIKQHPGVNGDVTIYRHIRSLGGVAKLVWDAECEHLDDRGNNPYPVRTVPLI